MSRISAVDTTADADRLDRAYGALLGLAIGDALGMPTQLLSYAQATERYGVLDGFQPGPGDSPIAAGLPAGRVTDDTDQAVILARRLVAGGGLLDAYGFVADLQAWERRMIAAGSADLLGPSTKLALDRVAAGEDVSTAGRDGTTNGAAMRIAPVGIAIAPHPLEALVDLVSQVSRPTHGSALAIAGAAAVAAAVSAGVEGEPFGVAVELALDAAALAARGDPGPSSDLSARIREAIDLVAESDPDDALDLIAARVGTSLATEESVPAAFAIAGRFPADPWAAARHAASLGGDSDTIAAMAGAMLGAGQGASAFPSARVTELEAANPGLALSALAADLLRLRR